MKGICINQDSHDIISAAGRTRPSIETIKNFPKLYEGTHVTDFFINMLDNCATFPAKSITNFLDKYYQKEENGIPVDYSDVGAPRGMHYLYEELGIDYVEMQINGFREVGINPWLTYRMNDYHDRGKPTSPLFPDFYHEHPEMLNGHPLPKRFWIGGGYSYDFKHETVRELLLGVINESLEMYDPYGIELDFQREMTCFGYGGEYDGIEIMNGFMQKVDAIVKKAEERWGHQIKIAVRVMPEINICLEYGFDVMHWVSEGIVDVVVISARYESNDTDMPIKLWKSLLTPYGAELYACSEYGLAAFAGSPVFPPTIETFASFAASAFAQGADKFYLYNYYIRLDTELDSSELDLDPTHFTNSSTQYPTVIRTLGDPDTIMKMNRRHVVTYKDRMPLWRRNPYLAEPESRSTNQLPLTFCNYGAFRLMVGEIPEGAKVTFRFAVNDLQKALEDIPTVFANSVACEFLGSEQDKRFTPDALLCYDVPPEAFNVNLTVLVSAEHEITTRYVDVHIKVRD